MNHETAPLERLRRPILAIAVINLVMVPALWWRDGAWGSVWLLPELLLLPLLALWPTARRSSGLQWLLAIFLMLSVAALLGDALVRAVYSRPLDIVMDPWLLRAGYHLLDGSLGTAAAILAAVLAALGAVATALLLRRLVRQVLFSPAAEPLPPSAPLMIAVLVAGAVSGVLFAPERGAVRPALVDLVRTQSQQVRSTWAEREALLARAGSQRMQARAIPALAGRDVVLVFVESYGVSALDQPRYAITLNPVLKQAEAALAEAGLGAVSARMQSPIRGGQSWLSHATVLGGQVIDTDYWYSLLLDSGQGFLTDDLRLTGHTPLVVAPAIVRPWPEARALGFETVYPAAALDYGGPASGWVGVPDQYTLHRYGRHLRPRHPGPVFSMLLLISSHAPWSPGPPRIDDWDRLDQPDPWPDWRPPGKDPLAYWRDTDRLRDRYPESLGYSLDSVFAWAARDLPEGALLIVLGDHQAAPLITGHDAVADVPVHFVSSDTDLLARLENRGAGEWTLSDGLAIPPASSSSRGLETLRFVLREL